MGEHSYFGQIAPLPPHHSRADGSSKLELHGNRACSHVEDNVVHRVKSRQLLLGWSCPCDKVPLAQVGLWELEMRGAEGGSHYRIHPTSSSVRMAILRAAFFQFGGGGQIHSVTFPLCPSSVNPTPQFYLVFPLMATVLMFFQCSCFHHNTHTLFLPSFLVILSHSPSSLGATPPLPPAKLPKFLVHTSFPSTPPVVS